ncbi:Patatin-like serine hydrolase protein [Rutstroemia sp. NJR-2017a WRK4]|nr:Patatin-like serine hydrolase protein [Rutstroemia sp. NJR-2017a WRK4]
MADTNHKLLYDSSRKAREGDIQHEQALQHHRKAFRLLHTEHADLSRYFKPFREYQDDGLGGHNNPINLALWEQGLIWKISETAGCCTFTRDGLHKRYHRKP